MTTREGREALFIMTSNFEELQAHRLGFKDWCLQLQYPWKKHRVESDRHSEMQVCVCSLALGYLLFCFVKDYYLRLKSLTFLVCALTHEKFIISVIISVGLKILRRNSTVGRLDSDLQL